MLRFVTDHNLTSPTNHVPRAPRHDPSLLFCLSSLEFRPDSSIAAYVRPTRPSRRTNTRTRRIQISGETRKPSKNCDLGLIVISNSRIESVRLTTYDGELIVLEEMEYE